MEESSAFNEKEYLVLSYIMLNIEKPGVFNGSFEDISKATGIPVSEVRYIITKKLRDKGVIKLFEEPSIEDLQSKIESYISKIDRRDLKDEYIHRLIQIKDDYSNFDKLLRKIIREVRFNLDNKTNISPDDILRLFALNERLEGYRNMLRAGLSKTRSDLIEGNFRPAIKEFTKMSLFLYLMIPVVKRSKVSLENGTYVQIIEPNIHLVRKRVELLEEITGNLVKLMDKPLYLEKRKLSVGILRLFLSLKKEIEILKDVDWIITRIESHTK